MHGLGVLAEMGTDRYAVDAFTNWVLAPEGERWTLVDHRK